MIGKFVTKFIQSLPSWEVTKYYGRVCIYQLKCLKYKVQTSEAWFNFKCKFMPGSLHNEIECEETKQKQVEDKSKQQAKKKVPLDVTDHKKQKELQASKSKENVKTSSTDIKATHISKKHQKPDSKKYQEEEDYYMRDEFRAKKQRKA